jgi:hypothetical protein
MASAGLEPANLGRYYSYINNERSICSSKWNCSLSNTLYKTLTFMQPNIISGSDENDWPMT